MQLAIQVNVTVPNQPSSLAKVCDKLRASDVNVKAITCTEGRESTVIHLIVNDPETAKIVLQQLGTVTTSPVLGFLMKNKPGMIATLGRACAVAGVNIHNLYATTAGKEAMVYLAVDDVERAAASLKDWERAQHKTH